MKPLIITLVTLVIMGLAGCKTRENMNGHVTLSLFTPYDYLPEILNGEVVVLEEHLSTSERKGKRDVEGRMLDVEEISRLGLSPDFTAYFDTTGLITKVIYPGAGDGRDRYWLTSISDHRYKKASWIAGDTVASFLLFTYDASGDVIETKKYRAHSDTLLRREVIRYGHDGRISGFTFYEPDSVLSKRIELNWDDNRHVRSVSFINASGALTDSLALTYNNEGFAATKDMYDSTGKLTRSFRYEYLFDVMGNWVKKVIDDGKGKVEAIRTYTYR